MSDDDLSPDFLSNLRDLVRNKDQGRTGQRIGHFVLQEQLGQGGMAVVYLAEQENLGRKVAVKLLKRVGDDRARAYFDREAKMAASLDHPHIAKIFEVGEHEGAPYIAMQFVEGETFSLALLTMDMNQRVRAVLDMARALEYAHSRKVIHRDIKPDNILVDRQGQVFITDFGLAKMESSGREGATASSVVAGTPAYMAPEQARAKADAQSDLYSLGAILYQCMTGQPPFLGKNASEVLVKVLEEDPSPPRQLNASVPEDLEAIIMKALEKKKEHRYQTATELVEDLDAFVTGKPVRHARRATPGYVIGKLLRRQPVLWSLAAGLLLAIGLGSTIGVSLFSRAEEESTKRQQLELRRKLEARIDPLRKKIEDTRFFFYIANVDIREKLEAVRTSLEEVVSIMESPENADFAVGWRTLGVGYYFIGDRILAEKYLTRADELSPNNRVTNQFLGRICLDRAFQYKNGDLGSEPEERGKKSVFWAGQARSFLENKQGDISQGKNIQSHVARAYLSWLKNDIPQLIRICDQSLVQFRRKLGLEEFWNLKGMISEDKDREENYTQAISHCPHYAWGYYMRANSLFYQGKLEFAAEDFTKAIEINPRHADSFNGRGVVNWRLGRMEAAEKDFSGAILIDAGSANYWNNRGAVRFGLGRVEEARVDYKMAVTLSPTYSDAHYNWGNLLLAKEEYEEALKKYDRAIEFRSNRDIYFHNRAVAKRYLGQIHDAVADYGRAIELNSNCSTYYLGRGELWQILKEWQKAFDDYNRAVGADSQCAKAFHNRGYILFLSGDNVGAIENYNLAIQIDPKDPASYIHRGVTRMKMGEYRKAAEDYTQVIQLDPSQKVAWFNRGRTCRKLGDPQGALRDYSEAIRLDPKYAEAWTNRGDVYKAMEDRESAIRDYQKALEVAPKDWSYREQVESTLEKLRKKI